MDKRLFSFLLITILVFGAVYSIAQKRTQNDKEVSSFLQTVNNSADKEKINRSLIQQVRDPRNLKFQKFMPTKSKITCINPHKTAVEIETYRLAEGVMKPKENIEYLCYNQTDSSGYLLTSQIVAPNQKDTTADINLYAFNPTNGKTEYISQVTAGDAFGGCGEIVTYNQAGNVELRCGWGKDNWSKQIKIVFNVNTKSLSGSEYCSFKDESRYCSNYCQKNSECNSGSVCNLETNSCLKRCASDSQCQAQSCKPLGDVMACQ